MLTIDGKRVCEALAEVVDPGRAALAVIDIENSPMWDDGSDRAILERVQRLVQAARAAGVPVFFFYNFRGPGLRNFSAAYLRALINLGHPAEELQTRFEPAADRMRVHPCLEPAPGDVVIPKDRGSAFKGTDFDLLLRTLQRETVVVTGCSTDWCVEATAWDGNGLDYYLVMVEDCLRSPRPDGHKAALRQFRAIGLDLTTSAELLHLWERAAPAPI